MLKTIIFRAEELIFNEDYLQFKLYEKLWHYLRSSPEWDDFETVLKFREYYLAEKRTIPPHEIIAAQYLPERDRKRFEQDVALFLKKQSSFYLRSIPAMLAIIRNLKYYYKIALVANQGPLFEKVKRKYRFDRLFHYITQLERTADINQFGQLLHFLIKQIRASAAETLLVSSYLYPDIFTSEQQGISALYTSFDARTRGFQPQNYYEWKYYHSLQRSLENRKKDLTRQARIEALATKPAEVSKFISQLERADSSTVHEAESIPTENVTLWDMAREIFAFPYPPEKT